MKRFRVREPEYYLRMHKTPPCKRCDSCKYSIKIGKEPCPYLDADYIQQLNADAKLSQIVKSLEEQTYTRVEEDINYDIKFN